MSGNGALDMKVENTTGKKVEMYSERVAATGDAATWVRYQNVTEDGKTVYGGVLHKDTYGAPETENGETISMDAFEPAPVNP